MTCLRTAWNEHQAELRRWAQGRTGTAAEADDVLQDVFMKALKQGGAFCDVKLPRAWLFEVARNTLIDRQRARRDWVELPEELAEEKDISATVDELTQCLPRVLSELSAEDREAIELCDLQGLPQAEYAQRTGLSLSAAKSRIQRARARLKRQMTQACQVQIGADGAVDDFVMRAPLAALDTGGEPK